MSDNKALTQEVLACVQHIIQDPVSACRTVQSTLKDLGWAELRPWEEFFQPSEFKSPSNLQDRISTNFVYYRSNYVIVAIASLLISIMSCPSTVVVTFLGVLASAVTLIISRKSEVAATVLALAALLNGKRILLGVLLGLVSVLLHMVFRNRSVRSRISAAIDEQKIKH